ncbi:hypothetical protein CPB84DRAFT_1784558 [Gymnopilus junonius]|uniref:Uncharacterized protein n=1 Tax=Gymnopilus junonius TaxID=109634 RepID=A0A9P5NGY6_GYMJU|nr:hypothetical protein CPB84DRAFT_1784558 [Gymnopilus junonius]
MGRLDANDTFINNLLPLNPGSEYPLYSDLFKAPLPADPFGMEMNLSSTNHDPPNSSFSAHLTANGPLPSLGTGWSPYSSPDNRLGTFQHNRPSGHFQLPSVLPYGEAENPNKKRFKQALVASLNMASSEFNLDKRKLSTVESAIRRYGIRYSASQ